VHAVAAWRRIVRVDEHGEVVSIRGSRSVGLRLRCSTSSLRSRRG
jgi:hypothetical protein